MWEVDDPYMLSIDSIQASREMGNFFKICRNVKPISLGCSGEMLPFHAFPYARTSFFLAVRSIAVTLTLYEY